MDWTGRGKNIGAVSAVETCSGQVCYGTECFAQMGLGLWARYCAVTLDVQSTTSFLQLA